MRDLTPLPRPLAAVHDRLTRVMDGFARHLTRGEPPAPGDLTRWQFDLGFVAADLDALGDVSRRAEAISQLDRMERLLATMLAEDGARATAWRRGQFAACREAVDKVRACLGGAVPTGETPRSAEVVALALHRGAAFRQVGRGSGSDGAGGAA